jgi:hypothetical protein
MPRIAFATGSAFFLQHNEHVSGVFAKATGMVEEDFFLAHRPEALSVPPCSNAETWPRPETTLAEQLDSTISNKTTRYQEMVPMAAYGLATTIG